MGDITPEELGRGLRVAGAIASIVVGITLAVIGFIKFFVPRSEHDKDIAELTEAVAALRLAYDELRRNQGKLTPEAEAQMIKILQKIDEFFSEKQRRKHG